MADTRSGEDRAPRPALRAEHATAAFVVLALVSVIAAFAWSWHVEHAVSPGQAGSEALQAGLRDLTDHCLTNSTIEGPLRRHCVEQAELLSQSPDCTADCQEIARSV